MPSASTTLFIVLVLNVSVFFVTAAESEYCYTPNVTKAPFFFQLSEDTFGMVISELATNCDASYCSDLIFGVRHTCWTADEVATAYIGGKDLPRNWTKWHHKSLVLSPNEICLPPLQVTLPQHRFCMFHQHVGHLHRFHKVAKQNGTFSILFMGRVKMEIQYLKPTFTVKENSSLTIACNATGQPVPRVEWAYPTTVEEGLLIKGNILHFDRIQPHHQGNYTCFAQQYNVVYRSEQNRVVVDTKTEFQRVEIIVDRGSPEVGQ